MLGKEKSPSDVDIIWNNYLQMAFVKILQPISSMLKFILPYFSDIEKIKSFIDDVNHPKPHGTNKLWNLIVNDMKEIKKYCPPIFDALHQKKFNYFKSTHIYLQTWATVATTETRMIIENQDIDKYSIYDAKEYENKLFYVRFYRTYAYFGKFIEKIKSHNLSTLYDGCNDCSNEIWTLSEILAEKECSLNDIMSKLENKEFVIKLLGLYDDITSFTYYSISKNEKCKFHGWLKKNPNVIYIYIYIDSDKKLYQIPSNGDTIDFDNMNVFSIIKPKKISKIIIKPEKKQMSISDDESILTNDLLDYLEYKIKNT